MDSSALVDVRQAGREANGDAGFEICRIEVGVNPRTWGTRGRGPRRSSRRRFIPTHVGNATLNDPPRRESAQQLGFAQLAALVVVEQVATYHAAGALVALHPDESNQRVCGRFDSSGRDCTPQRCRCTIPGLRLKPRALLRGVVVCQGERHQLVEVDALPPGTRPAASGPAFQAECYTNLLREGRQRVVVQDELRQGAARVDVGVISARPPAGPGRSRTAPAPRR